MGAPVVSSRRQTYLDGDADGGHFRPPTHRSGPDLGTSAATGHEGQNVVSPRHSSWHA
jgi:hypothetical protein